MPDEIWAAVDKFISDQLVPADDALDAALVASRAAGLPDIQVTPNQGMFLHLLALVHRSRRILEVGTLGGYSAIWLARALPSEGMLVTIEAEPSHAAVARRNLASAGVADRVEVREGLALDVLAQLASQGSEAFDLVFIDADKRNTPSYFSYALRLTRPGSLIIVDNVVRRGALADPDTADPDVLGMRRFLQELSHEPRVRATAIQTVGSKGHDGFAIALVLPTP